jgi:hypothetical protein
VNIINVTSVTAEDRAADHILIELEIPEPCSEAKRTLIVRISQRDLSQLATFADWED